MAKQKNKNRKIGRTKRNGQNGRYILEHRHEKSHVRRMTAHLKRWPNDVAVARLLEAARAKLGILHRS